MIYTAENIHTHPCPDWYRTAGLGIFIHWGLYSVPAFAPPEMQFGEHETDAYWFAHNPYAEWYLNSIRQGHGPAFDYHCKAYGREFPYENFADLFRAENFRPMEWAKLFKEAGAKYAVLTTKHHDGFCLWDTKYTDYNAVKRGPGRDLVAEFAEAMDKEGIALGLYYSGILDWSFAREPISNGEDLMRPSNADRAYADYAEAQVRELIDKFHPKVLWNDIGWPHAGMDRLPELISFYYNQVPDGVINDRWNGLCRDFYTAEYSQKAENTKEKWELCRGIGLSFGYNRMETEKHMLKIPELLSLYDTTIRAGGNLLLNAGPMADGTIPQMQQERLTALGKYIRQQEEFV